MIRRGLAAVILGPSLLIGSLAWSGFLALRTVFDEDRSRDVAEELLDNEEVRTQLADNLGTAIAAAIPAEVAIEDDQIDAAADQVLGDPVVEELIVEAFARTHAAFLGEGDAPRTLDLTPVAERARAAVVAAAPQVESTLPEVPRMEMTLPTDRIPDASPVRDLLRRTVPLLAAIAAVGVLLALFTTSDRPSVLRRAGFWALTTTAFYLAIGLGLPWLIRLAAPEQAEVIAALLTALLRTTLTPSIVLALVAAGLIVASFVWPEGARTHRPRVATSQGSVGYAPPPGPGRVVAPAPGAGPGRVVAPAPGAGPVDGPVPEGQNQAPSRYGPTPGAEPPAQGRISYPPRPQHRPQPPPAPRSRPGARFATREQLQRDGIVPSGGADAGGAGAGEAGAGGAGAGEAGDRDGSSGEPTRWLAPRWVEGHGWVLDPDDPKPPPQNARWVEGVGHVVPGPPPDSPKGPSALR